MKKALITGITGQDGVYLAEFLLEKGYEVHGIKRCASSFNADRIDHLYQEPHETNQRFFLHYGDLSDSLCLVRLVQQIAPDEIYNLGAQSHVAVSFDSPEYTADRVGIGALRILEAIRIAGLGVDNLVVIETKDAVLVADKSQAQNVKDIVDELMHKKRLENKCHRVVYRPWGYFDSIEEGDNFKVKRITVKPGASLSLQKHHHRSEHWVVVSGSALVTKGETKMILSENESVYINVGEVHALENPGAIPLELIEVQTGAYLGEDDIIRIDDRYGRKDA